MGRRRLAPAAAITAGIAVAALLAGCAGSPGTPAATAGASSTGVASTGAGPTGAAPTGAASTDRAGAVVGPGTLVPSTVTVPAAYRQAPFDVARRLSLPAGWTASVYTRIPGARFVAFLGPDLLVSQPSTGSVQLVRRRADGTGAVTPWLTGLTSPHDIVPAGSFVYVAESTRVVRYSWTRGAARPGPGQVVVSGLPTGGHELKNIAVVGGGLYVSIGSSCNVCASDTTARPQRAAIYRYPLAGGTGTLVATGLRNAEGLAEVPGTGALWAVTNNRDQIAYPRHGDITGDGRDDHGAVVPSYVDDHPMEPFVHVEAGKFYGWPFCNATQDTAAGNRDMPFEADAETNADGHVNCATAEKIDLGIQAHSAPLGLTFLQRTAVPARLRTGAAVALHGSWNRTRRTGYKVVWFDWQGTAGGGRPGTQRDLVTGWVSADGRDVWGRPVDVAADTDGSLLVSDDQSGTVYRLTPPR
jgi:glucose/arabinose dehydrogenase